MDTNTIIDRAVQQDFPCFFCGVCCSRYQVRVSLIEARNICDKLGLEWQHFRENFTDPRWPAQSSFLIKHKGGHCIFLKTACGEKEALCSINRFKPSACIDWTAGPFRKECRLGLERDWSLTVDEDGQIVGAPQDILRFKRFLESAPSPSAEEVEE
jgi:hypothetical protein